MELFKTYYNYVNNPTQALRELFEQRGFGMAFWGYFVAALSWVLFFNTGDGLSAPAFLLKLFILFAAEITLGYIAAAFCSLFLDLFKVKNSAAGLFIMVGMSGFIKGLLIAFALISAAFPFAKLGYLFWLALLFVWSIQLGFLTRNVMRAYNAHGGKAFVAWVFTAFPLMAGLVLLGVFFIWGIALLVA